MKEELYWYANNFKKLRVYIYWISRSTHEIGGALISSLGRPTHEEIHYMTTKFAFEENFLKSDLEKIIFILDDNLSRDGKLYIVFEHTKDILEYINTELSIRQSYRELHKIEVLYKKLIILLKIIESFKNETETFLLEKHLQIT